MSTVPSISNAVNVPCADVVVGVVVPVADGVLVAVVDGLVDVAVVVRVVVRSLVVGDVVGVVDHGLYNVTSVTRVVTLSPGLSTGAVR